MPAQSPPLAPIRARERHFFAREFEHRSGRIIALCRFVLATVFFIALWLAPDQPARNSTIGYVMLFGYLLLSSAVLMIAWRNWWWDQRLAWPMHVAARQIFRTIGVRYPQPRTGASPSPKDPLPTWARAGTWHGPSGTLTPEVNGAGASLPSRRPLSGAPWLSAGPR
mgnify:FL=1